MSKILSLFFALLVFSCCLVWAQTELEPFEKKDRVLILAPHPDDEAIACAGVTQQALLQGAQVKVLYLTNGDHNEFAFIVYEKRLVFRKSAFIHLGEVRRREAIAAMELAGLKKEDLIFLGYPDFGTFAIFNHYWQSKDPFMSLLTRISRVPYKDNFSFGSPYKAENILSDIKKVILSYKPNKIFVSHPADTNPDHRALYLFLQVVLSDLKDQISPPKIYPYLIHVLAWPLPRDYHPELALGPPKQFSDSQISWFKIELTPEQLEKKYKVILSYPSQTHSAAFYLLSFARKNELFGDYPRIEVTEETSLKEKAVSFFAFSDMFVDSDIGIIYGLESAVDNAEKVSYACCDNNFIIRIDKPRHMNRRFSSMVYLFGYSYKTPFAFMPKITLLTKYKRCRVFNGKQEVSSDAVSLNIDDDSLVLKIPLSELGDPDYVLASVRAFGGKFPADATGFRKIEIKQGGFRWRN